MQKVVILSCSTGEGHNSCAYAVREYLEQKSVKCSVKDALNFVSPRLAAFISWGHSFMYRKVPELFRWGYRYSEKHPQAFEEGSLLDRLLSRGIDRMYDFLCAEGCDTIVCTHVFAGMMVTKMMRKYQCVFKTAIVTTDYTYYPGLHACTVDRYFIADETLREIYRRHGIPSERIVASGIPIRSSFFTQRESDEARSALGIRKDSRHLLMMCGSMGCGPIQKTLAALSRQLPGNTEITVICSHNRQLHRRLLRKYKENRRIHPVGHTDQISLYMDSADLYLTKPGGISITEAATKSLPMVFVNAVAGCEQYNMEFFLDMGAAVAAEKPKQLADICIRLLASSSARKHMNEALWAYGAPNGAERIYQELSGGHRKCNRQS